MGDVDSICQHFFSTTTSETDPLPYSLLKKLRSEAKTVGGLSSLGLPFSDISQLLKSDLYKQGAKYGVDMRDDGELYDVGKVPLNNLCTRGNDISQLSASPDH